MAEFKYSLHLSLISFILLAAIAAHVTSARVLHNHAHNKSSHIIFSQNLLGSRKGHNIQGIHHVKTYLKRYGYFTHTQSNAFDDHLESALKTYQKFFNLNVSGILDNETLSLMSQPRCAVPDIFHNETSTRKGWGHEEHLHMGSHYLFFPRTPKWPESKCRLRYSYYHDFPMAFKDPVNNALELWSAYLQFGFVEVGEDDYWADLKISFEMGEHGDGHPFIPTSGVLAHAFAPRDGRFHFNVEQCWTVGARPNCQDVMSVAVHEIGHLLGLGHSGAEEAIMWPCIRPNAVKGLFQDNVAGIKALYGLP
ncbi:metalloendoproteinase 1-like [Momordica charantia]|uniref:Metalloendoproteinase 1-like n=1 Tax=Momordica charantia TaxID=3673 RepID=A0A6J1BVR3_MOMCH|nr:metalloendoproteinase 1-like [Momordica charantia]